jgi:YggT family protein
MNGPLLMVLQFLYFAVYLYQIILLIRIVLSWINPDPYNRLVIFLCGITDPLLDLARRYIPIRIGMIDLSPIIVFFLLYLVQQGIGGLTVMLARSAVAG